MNKEIHLILEITLKSPEPYIGKFKSYNFKKEYDKIDMLFNNIINILNIPSDGYKIDTSSYTIQKYDELPQLLGCWYLEIYLEPDIDLNFLNCCNSFLNSFTKLIQFDFSTYSSSIYMKDVQQNASY